MNIYLFLYLLVLSFSFYGFGGAIDTMLKNKGGTTFTRIMVGLSFFLAATSLLSALHLFVGLLLDAIIVLGAVCGAYFTSHERKKLSDFKRKQYISILVQALVFAGVMATMLHLQPPTAFNMHDDLQRYFAHPVRMLQTGTNFGNPLDTLGVHLPGGAASLQALILHHFSIAYIDSIDSALGFSLCIFGLITAIPNKMLNAPIIGASILGFIMVNPQYVNVTPIYMPAAIMLACISIAQTNLSKALSENGLRAMPISLGLLYAGLISLKLNYILFPFMHFVLLLLVLVYLKTSRNEILKWAARVIVPTVLVTGLWLIPWMAYSMTDTLDSFIAKGSTVFLPISTKTTSVDFFSTDPLLWGGTFLNYSLLALGALLPIALSYIFRLFTSKSEMCRRTQLVLAANSLSVFLCYAIMVGSGPFLFGYEENLRYAIPFVMASVSYLLLLLYASTPCCTKESWRAGIYTASIVAAAVYPLLFYKDFSLRYSQMVNCGNQLAFRGTACSLGYKAYKEEALSATAKQRVAIAQSQIPAGVDFLSWIGTPFLLDFNRNHILNVGGLSLPWAKMPDVNYFMFEYDGLGNVDRTQEMRALLSNNPTDGYRVDALATMVFWKQFLEMIKTGHIKPIYDDGRIRVYRHENHT